MSGSHGNAEENVSIRPTVLVDTNVIDSTSIGINETVDVSDSFLDFNCLL